LRLQSNCPAILLIIISILYLFIFGHLASPLAPWILPFFILIYFIAKITSLSLNNLGVAQAAYQAKTGKSIELPDDMSQSDPRLQELNLAFTDFVEDFLGSFSYVL